MLLDLMYFTKISSTLPKRVTPDSSIASRLLNLLTNVTATGGKKTVISDIFTDLKSGTVLCELMEVLRGEPVK